MGKLQDSVASLGRLSLCCYMYRTMGDNGVDSSVMRGVFVRDAETEGMNTVMALGRWN